MDRTLRRAGGERTTSLADIEIFAEVVGAGSMTAAAQRLGLAVAGVSKRIQRLEAKLGTRLLERSTRRIVLTEAGEGFHDRVGRVLEAFQEAIAFTAEVSTSLSGTLRVAAPTGFGRVHLAPHISKFLEMHPDLQLELELTDAEVDLATSGYHLALRIGELQDSALFAKKLAPISEVLCAAPAYLESFGEPTSVDELLQHQLLTPKTRPSWRLCSSIEGGIELPVRGRLKTSSSDVIRQAVIGGAGIGLLPTWSIDQELAEGRLRVVLPQYRENGPGLFAMYTSKELMPRKARTFIDFLAALYGPRPYWERRLERENGASVACAGAAQVPALPRLRA